MSTYLVLPPRNAAAGKKEFAQADMSTYFLTLLHLVRLGACKPAFIMPPTRPGSATAETSRPPSQVASNCEHTIESRQEPSKLPVDMEHTWKWMLSQRSEWPSILRANIDSRRWRWEKRWWRWIAKGKRTQKRSLSERKCLPYALTRGEKRENSCLRELNLIRKHSYRY